MVIRIRLFPVLKIIFDDDEDTVDEVDLEMNEQINYAISQGISMLHKDLKILLTLRPQILQRLLFDLFNR